MILSLVLVAIGGAGGSAARYLVGTWVQHRMRRPFPLGTLVVNMTGCLLVGVVFGLLDGTTRSPHLANFLVAGILGGYTTFSTFSVDNLHMLERGNFRGLMVNVFVQVAGGLLLAGVGYWLIVGTL